MENYDVAIIGGGPGGYLAAERAAGAGLKTVLFEEREVGGVCLNEGCIPSKALLYSAKILTNARHAAEYGVSLTGDAVIDQEYVIKRKAKVVRTLVAGVKAALKKEGAVLIKGKVKMLSGDTAECGGEQYKAKNLIIATGSAPSLPPIPGLKEGLEKGYALTNREILDLTVLPESLAVIGGGVIGLEMAAYYSAVGVRVTVIEMLEKIAGATDAEISEALMKILTKQGVTFELGARVTELSEGGVRFERGGESFFAAAEKILVSIGRRPVLPEGAAEAGIRIERGAVVTDEFMRTNLEGVYAVGDVNGKLMLAHTAYREAETAVNNILGKADKMDYSAVPSVIYTTPEIGSVGETEESALKKGLEIKTAKLPMTYAGRYVAESNSKDGMCKVVTDAVTGRILGAHVMGSYASEYIVEMASMIALGVTVEEMKKLIFPHPTVSEILRETIFEIK